LLLQGSEERKWLKPLDACRRREKLSTRPSILALLVVLLALASTSTALAKDPATVSTSDKAAAREAMDRGDALFDQGKTEAALTEYLKADEIMGVPSTGVLVGKAYEKLGKLVEAHDAYLAVGRYKHTPGKPMPDAFVEAKELAAAHAAAIEPKIPTLIITIEGLPAGTTPEIAINGETINAAALTRKVNPGTITVTAKAPGYLERSETASLAESDKTTVTLKMEKDPNAGTAQPPSPTPTPSPSPKPAPPDAVTHDEGTLVPSIIAFSIGGAALIAGAVTGGLTFAKESELADTCPDKGQCDEPDLISEANTMANVSNAMFAVAGVGAVLGVVFIFVFDGDDEPEAAAIAPMVGPALLGLRGRF
jgi:hypothetical protein